MPDLDFAAHSTLYATHGLHPFAAKCPPPLVRYGLRYYSRPDELVLDPMAGSGTTLVESRLMGRHSIGYEIDPLALLITRVKSSPLADRPIHEAYELVRRNTVRDMAALTMKKRSKELQWRAMPPEFPNRDYWFQPTVSSSLALLSYHIADAPIPGRCRDFLWVAFSSIILSKYSVANARDIIHSRHHHLRHDEPPNALSRFDHRVHVMRRQMADFLVRSGRHRDRRVAVRAGDARHIDLRDDTIDLVFTSPPYVTALDYPRAHFLAVAWMQAPLGITVDDYKARASDYIGSGRGSIGPTLQIDNRIKALQLVPAAIHRLEKRSHRAAALTHRYFLDMYEAFTEMHRVLKERRHAVIVVCPSHIRKTEIPTHRLLAEIGNEVGLKLRRQYRRRISKRLRIMPYMQGTFGKRMSTEYVLVFQKRA